jgi:LmbE family N-acetylglucosaminyl deacetylase
VNRTLVIAAHMDDEVLGAGGLIRKRVCCEDAVRVLTCFSRKYPGEPGGNEYKIARQRDHFTGAQLALGYAECTHMLLEEGEPQKTGYYALLEEIEYAIQQFKPTEVVIPGRSDLNQDHRHLNEVCRADH